MKKSPAQKAAPKAAAKVAAKKSKPSVLRVGFVGAGGIARTHMRYLKEMPDVELVAVSDVNRGALEQSQKEAGIAKLYDTWQEMLKKEQLDAVSVCTPNGLHMQPTIDALNAGCHVLVEKPLAMDAKEGEKMLAAAEANGKELVIAFQWRYDARTQVLKRAVDAGMLGEILYMDVQAIRRRGIPNWGVFGRKDLQGGGPLIDIGVHVMEMAHYVMGSPKPVAASGMIQTYMGNQPSEAECMWPNWDYKTYTVEDLAVGQIRFENGAVMQVKAMFAGHLPDAWNFQFTGHKGGGRFEPLAIFHDQAGTMFDMTPAYTPKVDHFKVKMRRFVDTALHGQPNEAPASAGLMIQKMIDGIYRSAAAGKEVAIK